MDECVCIFLFCGACFSNIATCSLHSLLEFTILSQYYLPLPSPTNVPGAQLQHIISIWKRGSSLTHPKVTGRFSFLFLKLSSSDAMLVLKFTICNFLQCDVLSAPSWCPSLVTCFFFFFTWPECGDLFLCSRRWVFIQFFGWQSWQCSYQRSKKHTACTVISAPLI